MCVGERRIMHWHRNMTSWGDDFVSQTEMEYSVISMALMRQFDMKLINETIAYSIRKRLWRFRTDVSPFCHVRYQNAFHLQIFQMESTEHTDSSSETWIRVVLLPYLFQSQSDIMKSINNTFTWREIRHRVKNVAISRYEKLFRSIKHPAKKIRRFFLFVTDFCSTLSHWVHF